MFYFNQENSLKRNVSISALVHSLSGVNVLFPVPWVIPSFTAQTAASANQFPAGTSAKPVLPATLGVPTSPVKEGYRLCPRYCIVRAERGSAGTACNARFYRPLDSPAGVAVGYGVRDVGKRIIVNVCRLRGAGKLPKVFDYLLPCTALVYIPAGQTHPYHTLPAAGR